MPPLALALVVAGYASGTVLAALLGGPWWMTLVLASTLAGAAALGTTDRRGWSVLLATVLFTAAGHARYEIVSSAPPPSIAAVSGTHAIVGVVRDDGLRRGVLEQVDVEVETVDRAPASGGLRLRLPARDEPIRAGERLAFLGRIEAPEATPDFDYAAFLRSRDIHALSQYPSEVERRGQTHAGWRLALAALHRQAVEHIDRAFPEPESALAAGVLVGERGTLPPSDNDALRLTGTTHLVVVSGQNIALLLGVAISALTLVMSRRRAAIAAIALLLVPYVLLVGADPPVVRAAIMSLGIALASVTGRRTPAWVYLVYAVGAMLAWDPRLARDVAFQLSATATAGVMLVAPPLRDLVFARFPRAAEGTRAALIETAATAVGASLAVLPVQVAAFERLTPWSVPANLVVAPLYEATFAASALAAVIGAWAPLAEAVGAVARFAPAAFLGVVRLLAQLPAAEVPLSLPLPFGVVFYAVLAGATWVMTRHAARATLLPALAPGRSSHLAGLVALAALAGGLWLAVLTPRPALASVTVLDVGQGLAILVEDGGRRVLIDAGPPDGAALRALPRVGATGGLDAIVVSHVDADHAGGVPDLLRRLPVLEVRAAPDARLTGDVRHEAIDIGDRIRVSDRVQIEVLAPPSTTRPAALNSTNDTGLVLLVRVGERRILLPADIERAGEQWLTRSGLDVRADAIVVPHHGSATSSSRELLDAVQPRVAVVSVGARNSYGHPNAEVLARYGGVRVYRTDESGDVALRSDGTRLWVAAAHDAIPVPTRTARPTSTAPR